MTVEVTRDDIEAAGDRISSHVRETPVLHLGNVISDNWTLALKLENLQVSGSFKARGAFNALLNSDTAGGVVAASGGNFGKAIAYASEKLGVRATIFVPETSPQEKIRSIAKYGADVKVVPGYYDEALEASREYVAAQGGYFAHAFDQHAVVAGQGTAARELDYVVPEASTVLVAVGGGGLIGGIASWFRGRCKVVGVEPEECPTLYAARAAGQRVEVQVGGIAASSLGARTIGEHAWWANQWIDSSVLVSESSILESQEWLWENCRLRIEPAAAVPIAAIQSGRIDPADGEVVVVMISGANVAVAGEIYPQRT